MAVILGNTKATICAALTAQFLLQPQKIANTFSFSFFLTNTNQPSVCSEAKLVENHRGNYPFFIAVSNAEECSYISGGDEIQF